MPTCTMARPVVKCAMSKQQHELQNVNHDVIHEIKNAQNEKFPEGSGLFK